MTEARRGRGSVAGRAAVTAALVMAPLVVGGFAPAPGYAAADQCAAAGQDGPVDTWAQRFLAPEQAWPLTTGTGQRVAVLDSGVDAGVAQLSGHVEAGYDAIRSHAGADSDCLGTGTHVAGAIAARKRTSGVYGVAPGATVVPVRVIGEPGAGMSATPTPAALARGIRWATAHHVDVIDISVWLTKDDPDVRQAVSDAVAQGITVVAAAGDLGGDGGDPTTYPAAYPDVIAVTAIGPGGLPWDGAERGRYVDLAAPGVAVPVLARDHGVVTVDGSTAVAAGYVSAAAALVRARWPRASASEVAQRLFGTASPAPTGSPGYGVVNPTRAVTAGLSGDADTAAPVPPLRPVTLSPEQLAAAESARRARERAVEWTAVALGALLVVTLLAVGIPRARRRAWRPAYAVEPEVRDEPVEPRPVATLFDE